MTGKRQPSLKRPRGLLLRCPLYEWRRSVLSRARCLAQRSSVCESSGGRTTAPVAILPPATRRKSDFGPAIFTVTISNAYHYNWSPNCKLHAFEWSSEKGVTRRVGGG